ncbi:MAG: GAF domain-containing sensor histidine kinase [Candidatus Limnocylindria bacterium]
MAGDGGERSTSAVGAALAELGARTSVRGLRLSLEEADPLPRATVGWGSLERRAGGREVPLSGEGDVRLARAWVDADPERALEVGAQIEVAVLAARALQRAAHAEASLAALDAAVRGIAGVLSIEHVLQLIVDRVAEMADARYAALGIVGEDGAILAFLTSGIDPQTRRRIGALPRGHGLLGLIIRENASFRIPDIAADPRRHGFPPHHPEMHSFLGVPITVRGRSVGNLYLTDKMGRREFDRADQELVERFALHAGIAIENARLHERVQQLIVVEERERIGRDLHDRIIQRIYGVNLSLDDVPEMVETDAGEAARRVDTAIDTLNATIGEIREFIYILRPPGQDSGDLGTSLGALAAEVRMNTSLPVEIEVDPAASVGVQALTDVLSIVREALSNAVRHAAASRATVIGRVDDGLLRLEIVDDGRGFDPGAVARAGHHGLVNIRSRAERLGGTLTVASEPGAGTRIIITLPLREAGDEEAEA